MSITEQSFNALAKHTNCVAAAIRDSLRATQFYARDLTGADGSRSALPHTSTALSKTVAVLARQVDRGLTKAANVSVRLVYPKWRALPSPFNDETRAQVLSGIASFDRTLAPEFTSYFFRAARHILATWTDGPTLILEHRIEAVRRTLAFDKAAKESMTALVAQILVALIKARPIAKHGTPKKAVRVLDGIDANIPVMAAAALALLLAQEGRPPVEVTEGDFLAIAGLLLAPNLPALKQAVESNDYEAVTKILESVASHY